ncbi:MAG TPA: hypothetical protein VNY52_00595 [Solirubrobacteraceae bacterium]|nr:hypothetical protein [Solirubrobacteraceae bacterium]
MYGTSTSSSPDALIDQVRAAAGAEDLVRVVAILWTWLEQHLTDLGSLQAKPTAIRAVALKSSFAEVDDGECEKLRERPLAGAAELLARIGNHLQPQGGVTVAQRTTGFDECPVVVVWKAPALAKRAGGGDGPPAKIEHPSLLALAPRLAVCPLDVLELGLKVHRPDGEAWKLAMATLERGLMGEAPSLAVHLDTLGAHGMSGWIEIGEPHVGYFCAERIDKDDELRCIEAAREAVVRASGGPAILIMPELAATPPVVKGIKDALRSRMDSGRVAPAITVVGLYHESVDGPGDVDPALVGDSSLATRVNEAVALGPDGTELWRHRKLTFAQGSAVEDDPVHEDVRPGRTVTIVPTLIGMVTVLICLDAFAPYARKRLEVSGADVLLVPSLSPRVLRHRTSLGHLVQALWGIAFVCNRAPLIAVGADPEVEARSAGGEDSEACEVPDIGEDPEVRIWNADYNRSFWAIQRKRVTVPQRHEPHEHPSFVFRLAEHTQV